MLRLIEPFLLAAGMAAATFGRRAANDPRLVFDLRRGREPGPKLAAKVRRFLAEQAPAAAGRRA